MKPAASLESVGRGRGILHSAPLRTILMLVGQPPVFPAFARRRTASLPLQATKDPKP